MISGSNLFMKKTMQDRTVKNSGLTLIEVLVAMSIFLMVIAIVVNVFVSGSNSQRKILEFNATQREAGYLMETISRELRMAIAIDSTQENNSNHIIEFTNYDGILIKYCRSDSDGNCTEGGKYFSREGENINSSDIEIDRLIFYVTDNFDGLVPVEDKKQPIVTISMKVKSTGSSGTELILQNSVSMRLY